MRVFITIPLFATREPITKIAISVPELVQQTNSFSVKHRPGCQATLIDSSPKDLFLRYNVKCHEKYSDPNGHEVLVHFDVNKIKETGNANDLDVRASCSCPAFLYWGAQWNMHQRDSLEGQPRPELRAPTERLDLRSHFVICKHCKAVFERILPAVQHNINNLLRGIEVEKNKKRIEQEVGEGKEQPTIRRKVRPEIEKIRKEKNKEVRKEMLDALMQKEEERIQHEHDLEHEELGTTHQVERDEPASGGKPEKKTPAWMELPSVYAPSPEEAEVLEQLTHEEEERLHEEGKPHSHKTLPDEVTEEFEEKEKGQKRLEKLRKRRNSEE